VLNGQYGQNLHKKLLVLVFVAAAGARDLGNLSTNPYAPNSISNPYGMGLKSPFGLRDLFFPH
jgi:hypothetical protein